MPVNAVNLTTNGSNVDATSYNTASITPGKKCLILAWVWGIGASTPAAPTLTGNGLTWVQVATVTNGVRRLTLFRAMETTSNPTAGAVTINFGATATGCTWSIAQFSNVKTTGSNGSDAIVQSVTNSATSSSLTVTLAAFGSASNATAAGFGTASNAAITAGSGFTELGNRNQGSPAMAGLSQWRSDNDTTANATFTSSVASAGIAVELAVAPDGASISTTNLALWLKADKGITLNNGRVETWADQSGNSRDFTQTTAADRPYFTEVLEGKTVVSALGTGESLDSSWTPATGDYTVFVVVRNRRTTLTNHVDVVFSATGAGFGGLRFETFNYFNNATQKRVWAYGGTVVPYKNGFYLSTADVTRLVTDEWLIASSTHDNITEAMQAAQLFTNLYSVVAHEDIAELIIYSALLTDAQRRDIDSYLAARWGQQHPDVAEYSICCTGDSLTQGYPLDIDGSWPHKLYNLLGGTNRYYIHNVGVDGLTVANVDYNAGLSDGIDNFDFGTSTVVLVIWAGTNDKYADLVSDATIFSRIETCIENRVTANNYDYILFGNCLPRANDGGFATLNSHIETNIADLNTAGLDTLISFDDDTAFDEASDSTSSTYYETDQIHLKDAGQVKIAQMIHDAIIPTIVVTIAGQDIAHGLAADNTSLTLPLALSPADALHGLTVDAGSVNQAHVINGQDGSHGLTADNTGITQLHQIATQDGSHALAVDNTTLSQLHDVTPSGASHTLTAESNTINQSHVLSVQDGNHNLTAGAGTMSQAHVLSSSDTIHGLTADTSSISQAHIMALADIAHGLLMNTTSLTLPNDLAPVDLTFPVSSDSVTLTQVHGMDTQNSTLELRLDTMTLSQLHDVTASDFSHGLLEDSTSLTQSHDISVQDGQFALAVDVTAITQIHEMTASDIAHGFGADDATMTQAHLLGTQNAALTLLADTTGLSQVHHVAVNDASHPLRLDTGSFFQGSDILPNGMNYGLSTDSPSLTQLHVIGVQDGAFSVLVSDTILSQNHQFSASDFSHSFHTDTTVLVQGHTLITQDAALTLLVDTATLDQLHDVTATSVAFSIQAQNTSFIQDVGITASRMNMPLSMDLGSLSQVHAIIPQDTATGLLVMNGTVFLANVTPSSRTITITGRLTIQVSSDNHTIIIPD